MRNDLVFSKRLRQIRKENRLTQRDLSKKIGISVNSICAYERGTLPGIDVLADLSIFFAVSSDWLLGLSGESKEDQEVKQMSKQRRPRTSGITAEELAEYCLSGENCFSCIFSDCICPDWFPRGNATTPEEIEKAKAKVAKLAGQNKESQKRFRQRKQKIEGAKDERNDSAASEHLPERVG